MNESKLRVELGDRSYDIEIGDGVLATLPTFIEERSDTEHVVVVTDSNVDPLHGDRAADMLSDAGYETHVMVIEPGETSKSPDVACELWETMLEEAVDRQSVVVAVGGGVVGDVGGFVAATYARGLDFYQVPTTLLAQVDSSVGGKVGVNLPGGKNMIGAFWQPKGVLIDVATLQSLPEREYRAGLAEVVKYGVILDADFFAFLEANVDAINRRDSDILTSVITRSCRLKADIVEQDERESGIRSILNYGHTFGHALEAITNYTRLLHGEAVAIGMICACRLAEQMGLVSPDCTQRQVVLLSKLGLQTAIPVDLDPDELYAQMFRDKKVREGKIRFVLPSRIGSVELVNSARAEHVRHAMRSS